jgi:hypothetical protein
LTAQPVIAIAARAIDDTAAMRIVVGVFIDVSCLLAVLPIVSNRLLANRALIVTSVSTRVEELS